MTRTAFRLLRGYLVRSAWLYSGFGLLQFLLTDFYWKKDIARVSVPAALLGLWGITAAIDKRSLVWRSLPLGNRDAGIFRWWAIAGAPGLWISLCDLIAWASQRTSPGVSAPPLSSLFLNILLGWAAIGIIAVLPSLQRIFAAPSAARLLAAFAAIYVLGILYGLPLSWARPEAPIAISACGLLLFSGLEAVRGRLWRWSDVAAGGAGGKRRNRDGVVEPRFGVSVILVPLLKQTGLFGLAATGGVVLLYRLFPGAGAWLFWSYFLAISSAGFLLTYQVRSAIQILRILPLSARQLAARLQIFAALPGMVTFGLALSLNAAVLHLKLDLLEFATLALIAVAAQALPIRESPRVRMRAAFLKWFRTFQRLYVPFYVGVVVLNYGELWSRWWWVRWPVIALGVALCVIGYYTLERQLRMGIQPSSNADAFSAT